jgi:hypothetical protein
MILMTKPNGHKVEVSADDVSRYTAKGYKLTPKAEPVSAIDSLMATVAEPHIVTDNTTVIVNAIDELPKARFSKKTGKPGVKALEELLGFDITTDERDAAFSQWVGENADR